MRKIIPFIFLFSFFIWSVSVSLLFADEAVTIITYYPSPYGSYNDLYVANSLGIGTTAPNATLQITKDNWQAINLGTSSEPYTDQGNRGITWGYRSDGNPYYMINTKYKTYTNPASQTYTYSRLEIGWHTGIEMGAAASYGGVRFFNNSPGVGSPGQIAGIGDGGYTYFLQNVGIGTNAPAAALDVVGNIKTTHPYFIASSSDGWRSVSASGWINVVHNTVVAGNSGGWYNTSNGRFTAPVRGLYLFTSQHYIYSAATGPIYEHHTLGVNGNWHAAGRNTVSGGYTIYAENSGNYDQSTAITSLLYLNAGDYVNDNVYVSCSGAVNYLYGAYSNFQGALLFQM